MAHPRVKLALLKVPYLVRDFYIWELVKKIYGQFKEHEDAINPNQIIKLLKETCKDYPINKMSKLIQLNEELSVSFASIQKKQMENVGFTEEEYQELYALIDHLQGLPIDV